AYGHAEPVHAGRGLLDLARRRRQGLRRARRRPHARLSVRVGGSMLLRLAAVLVLTAALAGAGCATAPPDASKTETPRGRPNPFGSWARGNGTATFSRRVGPAGGSGVRSAGP